MTSEADMDELDRGWRKALEETDAKLEKATSLLRRAVDPRIKWDGLADEIDSFLRAADSASAQETDAHG